MVDGAFRLLLGEALDMSHLYWGSYVEKDSSKVVDSIHHNLNVFRR